MITVDENRRDDYLQQKRFVVSEPGCWPMKQAPEAGGCAMWTGETGQTGPTVNSLNITKNGETVLPPGIPGIPGL